MKHIIELQPRTTYEHAAIIARAAVRSMAHGHRTPSGAYTGAGYAGMTQELIAGFTRDAHAYARYAAQDTGTTVYTDSGSYAGTQISTSEIVTGTADTISDAADLTQVAALALIEAEPNADHNAPRMLADDVLKAAYKAVYAYVYAQRRKPATHTAYIEDMPHNDAGEITAPEYVTVTRYYDVDNLEDYDTFTRDTAAIRREATRKQYMLLNLRLQGRSLTACGSRLGITQQAASKLVNGLRNATRAAIPAVLARYGIK